MDNSRWVRPARRRRNLSKSPKVVNWSNEMAGVLADISTSAREAEPELGSVEEYTTNFR
jgi:hypothetical protein